MRITGGDFRGRVLKVPRGDRVRPTQDLVREALFSMLCESVPGCRFLDLFAGTGAVGLEAMSRGASEVVWVEGDRAVARLTAANVAGIAGEAAASRVVCSDAFRWIRSAGRGAAFELVFADPPYVDAREDGLARLAAELAGCDTVAAGGILVTEIPDRAPVAALQGWETVRDRAYGKTRLVLRRRLAPDAGEGKTKQ